MSALESGNHTSLSGKRGRVKDLSLNHSTNSPVTSLMTLLTVAALGTQRAAARFAIWLPVKVLCGVEVFGFRVASSLTSDPRPDNVKPRGHGGIECLV